MNEITALKLACKALKSAAHRFAVDKYLYEKLGYPNDYGKRHYDAYTEAYNVLTAMQAGLDGDSVEDLQDTPIMKWD